MIIIIIYLYDCIAVIYRLLYYQIVFYAHTHKHPHTNTDTHSLKQTHIYTGGEGDRVICIWRRRLREEERDSEFEESSG